MSGTVSVPTNPTDLSFKPTLQLISGRALGFALTFFIPVVLVRVLNQAQFGTYKQIFLIAATLHGVAQLGMAESLFYFLPRARGISGRYVFNALMVLAVSGLVCAGILGAASPRIALGMGNPALARYLAPAGAYLVLIVASTALEIAMVARKRFLWASWTYVASDLLRAVLLVVPAVLLRSVAALLAGAIAFAGLRCWAAVFYLRREFRGELKADAPLLKEQLSYALPFEMAVILDALQANFHQYAVSHYFDAAVFAVYSVGCLQIPLVDFVATPASNVMMVRMTEKIRAGADHALLEIWHDTTRRLALLFFPLAILLVALSREMITFLFTSAYAASVPIFAIWSGTMLLATLQTDGVLRVFAETRFLLAVNAVKLLLLAASMTWVLTRFGLPGAVGVTVAGLAFAKGAALVRMLRLLRVAPSDLLPWRSLGAILGAAGAAALPVLAAKSLLEVAPPTLLLAGGFLYATSYVALLLRFGLLNEGERLVLLAWLHRLAPAAVRPESSRG